MENCVFTFYAKFLILFIIGIIVVACDASYYMKKDHSLIKPYAGVWFLTCDQSAYTSAMLQWNQYH